MAVLGEKAGIAVLAWPGHGKQLPPDIGRVIGSLERKYGLTSLVLLCAMSAVKFPGLILGDFRRVGAQYGMTVFQDPNRKTPQDIAG